MSPLSQILAKGADASRFLWGWTARNTALAGALVATMGVLVEKHPSIATSYNNLASNLNDQGRFQGAEPFYRKALETLELVLRGGASQHKNRSSEL